MTKAVKLKLMNQTSVNVTSQTTEFLEC